MCPARQAGHGDAQGHAAGQEDQGDGQLEAWPRAGFVWILVYRRPNIWILSFCRVLCPISMGAQWYTTYFVADTVAY